MFDFSSVNLLIGTPAFNGLTHIDYNVTVMHAKSLPIKNDVMFVGNESLIPRARNTIISVFYYLQKYTHLLFLDGDIGLLFEGVLSSIPILQLLQHNKDVIGVPVKLKGTDDEGRPVYNVNAIERVDGENLYKVGKIGTACLMLSRKAVTDLVKEAIKLNDIYSNNKFTRGTKLDISHYDIFRVGVVDGEYLSEDFYACKVLSRLGYTIYCDDTVDSYHNGMLRV